MLDFIDDQEFLPMIDTQLVWGNWLVSTLQWEQVTINPVHAHIIVGT